TGRTGHAPGSGGAPAPGPAAGSRRPRRRAGAGKVLRHLALPAAGRRHQALAGEPARGHRAGERGGRMKLRLGLQARFLLAMAVVLAVVVALLALLLHRQGQLHAETEALGNDTVHQMVEDYLHSRGHAVAEHLAVILANPLYYQDLEAIGRILRDNRRGDLIHYLLVFDREGRLVHDGTTEIDGYGWRMDDPLAAGAVAAEQTLSQSSPQVLEVSAPIRVGSERIGGVRVGLSIPVAYDYEQRNTERLGASMEELARRYRE